MTRRFYDLLVSLEALASGALSRARELGFSGVGAAVTASQLLRAPRRPMKLVAEMKRRGEEEGIDVVTRLVVSTPLREGQVKALLRRWRRKFEIVSIHAVERRLTAFACRDSRVDIVTLLPCAELVRGDIMYLRAFNKRVELLLAPLHEREIESRAEAMANYVELIELLKRKGLTSHAIFSSGAHSVDTLRDPRSMAALLHVMGFKYKEALDAISLNPESLVRENRDKLSGIVPIRGVRVLGRCRESSEGGDDE